MTSERRDGTDLASRDAPRSELPTDPVYWRCLADRIEAQSLPELRLAIEHSRAPDVRRWPSLDWLDWVGRVGRWALPVAAVGCALWWTGLPSLERPPSPSIATHTLDRESTTAWRSVLAPKHALGQWFARPSAPSVGDLLPWTRVKDVSQGAPAGDAREGARP